MIKTLIISLLIYWPLEAKAEDLYQIFRLAVKHDPQFRAQQLTLQAEREQRIQASAHRYRPVIAFDANLDQNYQEIVSTFSGGENTQFASWGYRLSLSQPIYHRDRSIRLDQVDTQIRQSELALAAAEQALMLRVTEAYFAILAANDNLIFANAEKKALEKQLQLSQQRFEVGLTAITDVHEAQAGFDLAQARQIQAQNNRDNQREGIREIIGHYPNSLAILKNNVPEVMPEPNNIEAWTQSALDNNLQLKAQLLETEIIEKEIGRQRAGHHPRVDIVGSSGHSTNGGQFGKTETDFANLGIALNIPIYEGGQISSRTREAFHRHEAALENLEQTRRAVDRDSRQSFRGILSGISQIKAFAQALISSETAVTATRAGYEVGSRTAIDVVTVEQELYRAKRDYSQAKYDYILDGLRLKRAAGKLKPEDIAAINQLLGRATEH